MLESLTNMLSKAYSRKTGISLSEVRDMCDKETYIFGSEIKEMGFADKVIETENNIDGEKGEYIAKAKVEIENSKEILKEFKKEDFEKAAALLKPEKKVFKPAENVGKNINKTEVKMTLQEFLKSDPAAMQEYEKNLAEAKKAGADEVNLRVEQASKYITEAYGESVHKRAIKAACGEISIEALEETVSMYDEMDEKNKSLLAKLEQPEDTTAQQQNQVSTDGFVRNEEDHQAMIARLKGGTL